MAKFPGLASVSFLARDRNLIAALVKQELTGRFAGTLLGFLWTVVQPLLFAALYTIVFSVILRGTTAGRYADIPFSAWLLTGLLPWMFFSESLGAAARVIVGNVNMVKKTLFDNRVLPLSKVLAGIVNHLISLVILFVILLLFGVRLHWAVLYLPVIVLLTALFTTAWSYILSALNVFFRDIDHGLGPVLQFAFFATPVVYPAELIPDSLRFLVVINPMHHLISLYRQTLLAGVAPDAVALAAAALATGAFYLFADSLFRKLAPGFCDML